MNKSDLAFEIVIVAFVSAVMVVLRYNDGWVVTGLLDFLGILATRDPGISVGGAFFVVWLWRSTISSIVASVIFHKGSRERRINYALVTAAAVCINLLMGLGHMTIGE